uniref:NADH dehydrogenase subunit 4 n=1 Tax=Alectorobius fonsecai TaxID=656181 RepID=UPI0022382B49|nr:NADH dehydrogenase subunit 4 [Alectorobius fonsecai]UYB78309.1 NADH dehydrogenase subunit 4 [Alectorobius fonsecai]UYL27218.1 NADH dehydrogenase subunit 4 [Alectorobius fonsecai]
MLMVFVGFLCLLVFSFFMTFLEIFISFCFFLMVLFFQMNWSMIVMINEVLGMDLISFLLISLSLWIGILMLIASMGIFIFFENMFKFYVVLMILLLFLCFSITNLLGFYLLFESVLIPIIMLIIGWGGQPERLQAGIYMMFYTLAGSLPLLVFLLSIRNGVTIFYMNWLNFSISWFMFFWGILGFLVKMPMYFVHLWLPKAHVEAPIAGSMVLAGVLLKLGIYGIFRVKVLVEEKMIQFSNWIMSIILFGGMIISLICLCQVDIKALIAYSSVCHMGLALGGMFSMMLWGYLGNILMMVGHGLCSSGLFCLANFFYERFYTRSMILLKGLGMLFPYISLWWFMFIGVNMAAPPSMNLGGEIMLIGCMIKWSFLVIGPLSMLMFLSAGYSLYMYSFLNHGKGWMVFSVKVIFFREIFLMFMHFFPLIFWVMKMELFCLY